MTVPFHIAIPAWAGHVGLMLDVLLPSLLAPGNLPALGDKPASRVTIYTAAEDSARIEASHMLALLRGILPVFVVEIPIDTTTARGIYGPSTAAYADAMRTAHAMDAAFVAIPPDAVFSDGLLASLQAQAEAGARCVHTSGIRLDIMKARDFLMACRGPDWVLALSPRQMVIVALGALHHSNSVHLWDGEGDFLPSNLIWPIDGGDGLLVRCFHSYPAMIRPACMPGEFGVTLDDDFAAKAVPDLSQHVVLQDSDAGCAFELSPADKRLAGQTSRGVDGVRAWLPNSANGLHRWTARHSIKLHAGDIERTIPGAAWRAAEARAAAIMGEILA